MGIYQDLDETLRKAAIRFGATEGDEKMNRIKGDSDMSGMPATRKGIAEAIDAAVVQKDAHEAAILREEIGRVYGLLVNPAADLEALRDEWARLKAATARKPDEFYDYKQTEIVLSKWQLEAEALLYRMSTISNAKDRLREVQKAMQSAYVRGRGEAIERAQAQKEGGNDHHP